MQHLAVAAASETSASAGRRIAKAGGNAVDAAVACAIVSMCTDPGVIAPGAGGFIAVWPPDGEPEFIDAYAEMPGRGLAASRFGGGAQRVSMDYGGGMETIIGYGSVATPGAFAGLGKAHERHGGLPWEAVLQPAIDAVEHGFPITAPAAEYLSYAHDAIFGWDPASYDAVHNSSGEPLGVDDVLRLPDLANTLRQLAVEGPDALYTGPLGDAIAAATQANGGLLTKADLEAYDAIDRDPISIDVNGWTIVTNPPPAVGGATMAAMLVMMSGEDISHWGSAEIARLAKIQTDVLAYRRDHLDLSDDRGAAAAALLEHAGLGDLQPLLSSPSTSHTSAVDDDGLTCAVTVSAGYGSGAMVPGLGFWLNNSLGEVELHPNGFHALEPGARLVSNMAPTVARRADGATLAIGSPGADRITTALSQVLFHTFVRELSLSDAVAEPRLHVEVFEGEPTAAYEPGLVADAIRGLNHRPFAGKSMYFGGVQAVSWTPEGGLTACADARRAGASAIA